MRNIVSPLSGIRSPFGGRSDLYKTAGFRPEFVADFGGEYYRANLARSTFADTLTHAATSNATMVDSDGLLKWRPHNLLTYSEDFSNVAWGIDNSGASNPIITANYGVAPDGSQTADRIQLDKTGGTFSRVQQIKTGLASARYTFTVWLKNNGSGAANVGIRINEDGVNCEVTESWQSFTVSLASAGTTASPQILLWDSIAGNDETADVLSWGAHLYRSDLGGMVNNPDRGDSYVPTTTAAVYLPRRGHHVWNGSAWVDAGYLHESEARTNLLVESNDLSTQSGVRATLSVDQAVSPDGNSNAGSIADTAVAGDHRVDFTAVAISDATAYTFSAHLKQNTLSWCRMVLNSAEFGTQYANFNLSDGTIGAQTGLDAATVEDCGNGWYRCAITGTSIAAGASSKQVIQLATNNNTISYTGDGSSILIYGAQLEEGSTPSSHIPTNGSTATRAAETLTIPSANLPWGSAMSIQMEGDETFADEGTADQVLLYDRRVDANNRITLSLDTDSTKVGTLTLTMVNGGSSETISTTAELTPGVNDPFNVAFVCTSNELGIALDGTTETRVSHAIGLPDLSGADATFGGMGTRAVVREWAADITDAGLAGAST